MNPPPSYQEILTLLNKSKLCEMKLIGEIDELKRQLEIANTNLKVVTNDLEMFRKGYTLSKQTEYKLKKLISKM
jgi:hypothetical protein